MLFFSIKKLRTVLMLFFYTAQIIFCFNKTKRWVLKAKSNMTGKKQLEKIKGGMIRGNFSLTWSDASCEMSCEMELKFTTFFIQHLVRSLAPLENVRRLFLNTYVVVTNLLKVVYVYFKKKVLHVIVFIKPFSLWQKTYLKTEITMFYVDIKKKRNN